MDIVVDHFTRRAGYYDRSSRWCTDPALHAATVAAVAPEPSHHLLDVACGTGLVSRALRPHVARITGLDPTPAMSEQSRDVIDALVQGSAEAMPFADNTFDRIVCRQGTQFMDDRAAVREMVRVVKPGGRVVLVHLCAYGDADRDEYFAILRHRNPARRNFYLRGDLAKLLVDGGCDRVEIRDYVSDEDVDAWADNKAIGDAPREAIREVYRNASPAFLALHGVRMGDGRILDKMLFAIAIGWKRGG